MIKEKNDLANLFTMLEPIFEGVIDILKDDITGYARIQFATNSIIVVLLSLADYLTDILKSIHCNKMLGLLFEIVYMIAKDNNYGKAQIFKGQGYIHF